MVPKTRRAFLDIRSSVSFRPGNLGAILQKVTGRVVDATTKGTEIVLNRAKENCPVRTGALQASGKMVVTLEGLTVRGQVIFDEDYAMFVEAGTGVRGAASAGAISGVSYSSTWPGMPAQPYCRPSPLRISGEIFLQCFRGQGLI